MSETEKKSVSLNAYPLRKAAVLGAGVMGSQIAAHLANAGLSVELLDMPGEGNKNGIVEAAWMQAQQPQPAQSLAPAPSTPQRIDPPAQESAAQQAPTTQTSGMSFDSSAAVPTVEVATAAAASNEDEAWTDERIRQWCAAQGWDEAQISAYLVQLHATTAGSVAHEQEEEIPVSGRMEVSVDVSAEPVPDRPADVRESGVMKAMDGTEQGSTGWYLDAEGRPSYWNVDAAGNWERGE